MRLLAFELGSTSGCSVRSLRRSPSRGVSAAFLPGEVRALAPALNSYWLPVHVILLFFGNAVLAVAFGAGIMYLLMERELKRKKLGAIFKRLPSLNVLDDIDYRCLTIGFPLLTLGIITGSIWAEYAWGSYWGWDPKEVWSLVRAALRRASPRKDYRRLARSEGGDPRHRRVLRDPAHLPRREPSPAGSAHLLEPFRLMERRSGHQRDRHRRLEPPYRAVEVRERLAFPATTVGHALGGLRERDGISEGVILSTCNASRCTSCRKRDKGAET